MRVILEVSTFVVAVAAATRSTWSPCGVSMLSTVTPLAERGRGHRFGATAGWFVAGALAGGICLGAVGAGLAAAVGALGPPPVAVVVAAAVAAALRRRRRLARRPVRRAHPPPPGERALARPLPALGLRPRLRVADRRRRRDLRDDGGRVPDGPAGGADRKPATRPGRRRRVRAGAGRRRPARPRDHLAGGAPGRFHRRFAALAGRSRRATVAIELAAAAALVASVGGTAPGVVVGLCGMALAGATVLHRRRARPAPQVVHQPADTLSPTSGSSL